MMKAKALMVLGTGSGVGKSVIAAGFCRLLSDWGYRVAPFKAQNMSNNSWVTDEGGEMGRAQVVQAECARVTPHVDMNPVLLKPSADNCSQVVIQGKPIGHLNAVNYYAQREKVACAIRDSYERLASQYEVIVLEGAGSPAEVNLKKNDLVNMSMAEWADASCVLVGDIDKGGIFASLLGTLDLLEPGERDRISGFIVNKFRGDIELFRDGVDFLEKKSKKPVWGVLPYFHHLGIDEEDALPEKEKQASAGRDQLDIAVLLLPRMSNFTDFEVLKRESGVHLRYIKKISEFGRPDLLILPGTKATMADLTYLETSGLKKVILDYVRTQGRVLGICGGFQMMGKTLLDPRGVESGEKKKEGLGLINMTTTFEEEKILRRVSRDIELPLWGKQVKGSMDAYEIHMGKTAYHESLPGFGDAGVIHPSGNLLGTYYHGLFEASDFRVSFLTALAQRVQKNWIPGQSALNAKEIHYAEWTAHMEKHLNLDFLKKRLDLLPHRVMG